MLRWQSLSDRLLSPRRESVHIELLVWLPSLGDAAFLCPLHTPWRSKDARDQKLQVRYNTLIKDDENRGKADDDYPRGLALYL
jgi:hypothetical protein